MKLISLQYGILNNYCNIPHNQRKAKYIPQKKQTSIRGSQENSVKNRNKHISLSVMPWDKLNEKI